MFFELAKVFKDFRGSRVFRVFRGSRVFRGFRVSKVFKVFKALKALKALKAPFYRKKNGNACESAAVDIVLRYWAVIRL